MGLTREQARMCGIEHLYPEPGSGPSLPPVAPSPSERTRIPNVNTKGQNKTEARFDGFLADLQAARRIASFAWSPIKLRLAGRTWYEPDFLVVRNDGRIVLVEVKGFMRDDAAVKIKVAKAQYPFFRFVLVRAQGRGWNARLVTSSGGFDREATHHWWE